MDAVITAGGRISGEFAGKAGVTLKALIRIGGEPVICKVVRALREQPEVRRIFVVGPENLADSAVADLGVEILPETGDGAANIMIGLTSCAEVGSKALLAASDLPFTTADVVKSFAGMCPQDADLCYPVVRKERFLAAYPGCPVKFESLRGGQYTGGSVFLIDPQSLIKSRDMIERVFNLRKSPLKLAGLLGWWFSVGLLTRTVSVDSCARRASELIGCKCLAIVDSPPELAYDMDDLYEYEYAIRHSGASNA
jgi:molybdopterin-guanine dinucleotide biosynthesis protein A